MQNNNNKISMALMPRPRVIEEKAGEFLFSKDSTIQDNGNFLKATKFIKNQFNLNGKKENIIFIKDENIKDEGYKLEIDTNNIQITAKADNGIYNGMQTVRQLQLTYNNIIPGTYIEDYPKYKWRGFMLDCCRCFITVSEIKKLLDVAAMHHLNIFHWHLTDDHGWRLEIPNLPRLTEIGSVVNQENNGKNTSEKLYYSTKDVKEIIKYATERFITIVPELETPGHVSALLTAYPEYGCTGGPYDIKTKPGIYEGVLCIGNDKLKPFIKQIIDYVAKTFPGPYIHFGGDECPSIAWKKCDKCQKKIKELGLENEGQLQSYFTSEISKMIVADKKIPIGGDEVLQGTEKIGLPKELIVMSWRGTKGGIEASKNGHFVIMTPYSEGCYLDYRQIDRKGEKGAKSITTLNQISKFSPITKELDDYQKSLVLGSEGLLWTEYENNDTDVEYMLYPRLSLLAERLWNPCSLEDFSLRTEALKKRLTILNINYCKET